MCIRDSIRGLIGLHASFTVSDETIRAAGRLCRELSTQLHVHVAEDLADVEAVSYTHLDVYKRQVLESFRARQSYL